MDAAAEEARKSGAAYLFWSVFKPNVIGRRFYDGIGAQAVGDLDFMTLNV
jgi:hypothetical protein